MLRLPDITLIAFGTTNITGMLRALDASIEGIQWGAVKCINTVPCPTIDDWNYNIVFRLGEFVDTPFAMLIHPDGYVVNPESWWDGFREYDFIGAPWPMPQDDFSYRDGEGNLIRVGNSVSLRSKKLLDLPKKLGLEWKSYFGNTHEDGFITCHNRKILEENGCKFAPIEVAKYFSRERDIPENMDVDKPFAFHMPTLPENRGRNKQYEIFE